MRIYVKVSPKSSKNEIIKVSEGEYKVKITAAPISDKANVALIEILAKNFKVPKSLVNIVGGKTAKTKIVDIASYEKD
jgi:uncharacterized protein (TIGR00251 family)